MQMQRNTNFTSNEAWKQRKTRNRKVDVNSELILLAGRCGVEMIFPKTKRSSFSKKFYQTTDITYKGKPYSYEKMLEIAVSFECVLRRLWKETRRNSAIDVVVNKKNFDEVYNEGGMKEYVQKKVDILLDDNKLVAMNKLWDDDNCDYPPPHQKQLTSRTKEFLVKRKSKNREAVFGNFLSYILVQNGYSLECQVSSQKTTTKTLNYYLWKKYIMPNGTAISGEEINSLTRKVRAYLKE